jgi:flagellar basal body-associated protein FliL
MAITWVFLILILFAFLLVGGVVAFVAGSRNRENRAERHQSPGYKGQRPRSIFGSIIGLFLVVAVGLVLLVVVFGSFFIVRSSPVKGELVSAEAPRSRELPDLLSATAQPLVAVKRSTSDAVASEIISYEKLWDLLTEARIDLGDEPESDPPAETETKKRPEWVDKPPKRVGDVHKVVVESDPFITVDECFVQLEQRFPEEVERRLAKLVPSDQRSLVEHSSLAGSGVGLDYIMREICLLQHTEVVESSVGAMRKVYVLMEFTPAIEKHLLQSWQSQLRRHRLTSVFLIAGGILAALAMLYGMLQFDTWTRGYYTKRLLWGVPAAIIAVVTVLNYLH